MKWVLYSKQHEYTFQLVLSCELNSNGYSFGDRKLAGCCCQVPSVVSDSVATPETAAHQAPRSLGFSRQEGWRSYSLRWSSWRVQFSNHLSRAPWLSMSLHRNALKFHSSKGSFTKRCSGKSPGIQLWRLRFQDNVVPPTCYDYHQIVWLLWVSLPHLWWG